MINETPFFSIITPVYNGSEYLQELIDSVKNQSFKNFEHIIIDDGSTDEGKTIDILERNTHLRWWTRPNKGQAATINEGIEAANGKYICIISADDKMGDKDSLKEVANYLTQFDLDILYGNTIYMNSIGKPEPSQFLLKVPFPKTLLKYRGFVAHCSLYIKKDILIQNQIFWNVTLRYYADWDWLFRIFSVDRKFMFLNMDLAYYRIHENQIIGENFDKHKVEISKICKQYNVWGGTDFFFHAVLGLRNRFLRIFSKK